MYYLYLGRGNDFSSPESVIVEYQGNYFYRGKNTEWFEMEEEGIQKMLSGRDNRYYSIEKEQFEQLLSTWGGSRQGYKNHNTLNLTDNEGYGDSYDEEDEQ
jgi:hypothetical protein